MSTNILSKAYAEIKKKKTHYDRTRRWVVVIMVKACTSTAASLTYTSMLKKKNDMFISSECTLAI